MAKDHVIMSLIQVWKACSSGGFDCRTAVWQRQQQRPEIKVTTLTRINWRNVDDNEYGVSRNNLHKVMFFCRYDDSYNMWWLHHTSLSSSVIPCGCILQCTCRSRHVPITNGPWTQPYTTTNTTSFCLSCHCRAHHNTIVHNLLFK